MSKSQHFGGPFSKKDQLLTASGLFPPVSFCPHEMASPSQHLLHTRHLNEHPEGSLSKWGLLPAVLCPPASPDARVLPVSWTGLQAGGNIHGQEKQRGGTVDDLFTFAWHYIQHIANAQGRGCHSWLPLDIPDKPERTLKQTKVGRRWKEREEEDSQQQVGWTQVTGTMGHPGRPGRETSTWRLGKQAENSLKAH